MIANVLSVFLRTTGNSRGLENSQFDRSKGLENNTTVGKTHVVKISLGYCCHWSYSIVIFRSSSCAVDN